MSREVERPGWMGSGMSRSQQLSYAALRQAMELASRVWFRYRVEGREHLPPDGAFIVSPVHRSYLDTPILTVLTRRRLRFMGKETLWRNRFGAWFLTAMGGFPVERGTADRAALRAAETVLGRGEPLVMFPEGTRRSGEVVLAENMHDGPAFVSARAQVPIVPIGIAGTDRAMAPGARFVRPAKVVFVIGEPIAPPDLVGGRVPRRAVREHTDRLRVEIQRLYDRARSLRG